MMDIWEDITKPIAPPSAQRVTVGWRVPGKGSPGGEVVLSAALLRAIGWQAGKTRVRIKADTARQRLALVPEPEGKMLSAHGAAGSLFVIMPWVASDKRPCVVVAHRMEKIGLVLDLPGWAQGAAALDKGDAANVRRVLEDRLVDPGAECPGHSSAAVAPAADATGPADASHGVPDACAGSVRLDENPAAGHQGIIWTPARIALLRELWNDIGVSVQDLQTRLCELPGASMSRSTIYKRAKSERLVVPRYFAAQGTEAPPPPAHPAVLAAPLPPPAPPAGPITAATNTQRLRTEITELMASGLRGRAIAEQVGEPISVVLAHVAAIQAAQRAAGP